MKPRAVVRSGGSLATIAHLLRVVGHGNGAGQWGEQHHAAGSSLVGLNTSVGIRGVPGAPAANTFHGTTRDQRVTASREQVQPEVNGNMNRAQADGVPDSGSCRALAQAQYKSCFDQTGHGDMCGSG